MDTILNAMSIILLFAIYVRLGDCPSDNVEIPDELVEKLDKMKDQIKNII